MVLPLEHVLSVPNYVIYPCPLLGVSLTPIGGIYGPMLRSGDPIIVTLLYTIETHPLRMVCEFFSLLIFMYLLYSCNCTVSNFSSGGGGSVACTQLIYTRSY